MARYKVLVDDNFHYMRADEQYELGTFSTAEAAVAACKRVVDDDLEDWATRRIAAVDLYELYVHFGEDPFIVPLDQQCEPPEFSAWNYAKERSQSLVKLRER